MRIFETGKAAVLAGLVASAMVALPEAALALDEKAVIQEPEQRSPWAVFRFGFSAYKRGEKQEAMEAYRYAAENGQVGARWKLARMYAEGDGVTRNDYEAFKFFSAVAQQDVRPGSPDETYVSDALVALGKYLQTGIPNSPIRANPLAAQEHFMRAAATYRNSEAQYQVGKMFLSGEGVAKSVQQAARWFQLAAEKGHAGAQATLGHILFESGKIVKGLAMMTAALDYASPSDIGWIRAMQEQAFALAGESDRRTAIALAHDLRDNGLD